MESVLAVNAMYSTIPHALTGSASERTCAGDAAFTEVATVADLRGLSNEGLLFREELIAIRNEIKEFRIEFSDLRAAMCTVNERIVTIEKRMDVMEKQERDLDLQVSNVPGMPGKSPTHLAILIGVKLGLKLGEKDVVNVERVDVGMRRRVRRADHDLL
ncbi:hypothetical protein EVAR_54224_1 [Eumeta japonica]|uniref:Uncharacterized protein n=1 Tax=Eumeta variegata TaxID=151549 RepID=A0A4C1Z1Q9_EUMVA|nr:hypothetical protein EVAR_54224_1 [Eumeta japonica]